MALDQKRPSLLKTILVVSVVIVWAIVVFRMLGCFNDLLAKSRPWKPTGPITEERLVKVLDCMARQQGQEAYEKARPKYYTPDLLGVIARASLDALDVQQWPGNRDGRRWVAVLVTVLYQQSKIRHDAVSRYNWTKRQACPTCSWVRDRRIWIGHCKKRAIEHPGDPCWTKAHVWRHAGKRFVADLDLGVFQNNVRTALRAHPDLEPKDLEDPAVSIRLGVAWLAKRAASCIESHMVARTPRRCGRKSEELKCRCKHIARALGEPIWAGLTSSRSIAFKYAPHTRHCFDATSPQSPTKTAMSRM